MLDIILKQAIHQRELCGSQARTLEEKMVYLRDTCLALNIEVTEFLQELPWKPWRPIDSQPLNIDKAEEEIVDIIIFALNLFINLTDDSPLVKGNRLIELIKQKQDKNMARIDSGYNKKC